MASLAREGSFTMKLPPTLGLVVRDGRQVPIEDAASLIVDDASAVLGRVVVFRDITERLRLEARVAQAERLAALGTMIAGVAHEINNPLAYVINNVEFSLAGVFRALALLDDAAAGAAAREGVRRELAVLKDALRDAGEGAERIRLVVDELRKFCDGGTPTATVFELPSVLEFAIKMTAHAVSPHAAVRREFGATPPVKANDGALGQVFTNLLLNAAQAFGGRRSEGNEIVVSTHTDGEGRAVVEVRDTGPGIAPDVLSRLFDPFFTTKPVGQGMGLGLTICQNIIVGLGGFITVESPPGGGALFRVTLPPATGDALLAPSLPPPAATKRRGAVLVIDDEIAITRVVSRLLDPEHDVTTMSDGRDAVAAIAAGATFDVIFCDLMMPNCSGGEVYERILAINAEQARRIVFMTGGAFSRNPSDVLPSPANAQLHKPFTSAAIQAVVRDYVARADSA
jgi:signal transduction histidine kinase/CheY-like chemotaxis protein